MLAVISLDPDDIHSMMNENRYQNNSYRTTEKVKYIDKNALKKCWQNATETCEKQCKMIENAAPAMETCSSSHLRDANKIPPK